MSLAEGAAPGLSGVEQLRAMMGSGRGPSIGRTLDFALVEIEPGRAVFEGNPGEAFYNPIGVVHGGYAATLLDSACGCAVHAKLEAGWRYTTLELRVANHRPTPALCGRRAWS